MNHRSFSIRRRDANKLLLALPFASSALAQEKKPEEKPTPGAEFIAAQEDGLSDAERQALKKSITGFEKSLEVVRAFRLPPDIPPSVRFTALKSRKR